MRWSVLGFGLSFAAHLALAGGVARVPKTVAKRTTTVAVFEQKKQEKPKPDPKQDDKPKPPPPKEQKPILAPRAAPKAADNPPPAAAKPAAQQPIDPSAHRALAAMPDLGISMGGLAVGGPGIAVPTGGGGGTAPSGDTGGPKEVKAKVLGKKTEQAAEDNCEEDTVKPVQQGVVRPQYTDQARAAEIEGKVKVEITISPTGEVVSARVLKGLGYGLDEAAVTAAKKMKFAPATRCGKAVESKFTIVMRFGLTD